MNNSTSRYFLIDTGETVLEFKGDKCIRWDREDGPIETNLWDVSDPRLTEIDFFQAEKFMN